MSLQYMGLLFGRYIPLTGYMSSRYKLGSDKRVDLCLDYVASWHHVRLVAYAPCTFQQMSACVLFVFLEQD